jgi:dTDP-4-amino-4,6-dideoxygalactose transaminase
MKKNVDDLAFWGGTKAFEHPLRSSQAILPDWKKIEAAFKGIFERCYFANHGPLVKKLDHDFASFVQAKHAVCVTNGTVGLMVLAKALELTGEVIIPAYAHPSTAVALIWAGLTPVLCDVDVNTQMITPETIAPHITPRTSGILAVHLWGQPCTPEILETYASAQGLALLFDARYATGSSSNGRRIGNFGSGEVFSFHASKTVLGAEGGCITTNSPELADKMRTIRNFHPSESFAPVALRINGKMSEAQAALALLSMNDFVENTSANYRQFEAYRSGLSEIPGISLLEHNSSTTNSFQYIVLEIDEQLAGLNRDIFYTLLSAENIMCRKDFDPGIHKIMPYHKTISKKNSWFPNTDILCRRCLQLPNASLTNQIDIHNICDIIRSIQLQSNTIKQKLDHQA